MDASNILIQLAILVFAIAFASIAITTQILVQGNRQNKPREKTHGPVYPNLSRLSSLIGPEGPDLLCVYPKPGSQGARCDKDVGKAQRNEVLLIFRHIGTAALKSEDPIDSLSSLSQRHFCATCAKKATGDLKDALRDQWYTEWDSYSAAYRLKLVGNETKDGRSIWPSKLEDMLNTPPVPGSWVNEHSFPYADPDHRIQHPSTPQSPAPVCDPVSQPPGRPEKDSDEKTEGTVYADVEVPPSSDLPVSPGSSSSEDESIIEDSEKWQVRPFRTKGPKMLQHEILRATPLQNKQRTPGYIYVFKRPGCDQYYKVGWTQRPVEKRFGEHRRKCSGKLELVYTTDTPVPNAKKVERLIHLDFQMRSCRFYKLCWKSKPMTCTEKHGEIIKGDLKDVVYSVEYWCEWMTTYKPYHPTTHILKDECSQYPLRSNLDDPNNIAGRRFCSRSNGELWYIREGSNYVSPPQLPSCSSPAVDAATTTTLRRSSRPRAVNSPVYSSSSKRQDRRKSVPTNFEAGGQGQAVLERPPIEHQSASAPPPPNPTGSSLRTKAQDDNGEPTTPSARTKRQVRKRPKDFTLQRDKAVRTGDPCEATSPMDIDNTPLISPDACVSTPATSGDTDCANKEPLNVYDVSPIPFRIGPKRRRESTATVNVQVTEIKDLTTPNDSNAE